MNWTRPFLLALCVGLAPWMAMPAQAQEGFTIAFGPTTPEAHGLDDRFVELIDGARTSLDMCFYELRLASLADAIVRAHKRGVRVRFLCDDTNYYPKDEAGVVIRRGRNPFISVLEDSKIPVKHDNGRRSLMHNKFCVVDGRRVWTGSYNLTDTCSYVNSNNVVVVEDEGAARIFARKFEQMFADGAFGARRESLAGEQSVTVKGTALEVRFAPEDDPLARQLQALQAAKKEIFFMQFAFTADGIGDVLIEKAKEGVVVKGILDHRLFRSTGPYSEFSKLTGAGIPVLIDNRAKGKLHHKVFVVDAGTDQALVVTGSENTSNNGNEGNDENVLFLRSKEAAQRYRTEFDRLYGELSHVTADIVYSEAPMAGGKITRLDLVVSANGEEVDGLEVEFPARWKISRQTIARMEVLHGGEPIDRGQVKLERSKVVLPAVRLEPTGRRSYVVFKLQGLKVPDIAGSYSPIVRVRPRGQDKMVQLAQLPVLDVYSPGDPELIKNLFHKMADLFRRLQGAENIPEADRQELGRIWETNFQRLRETVLRETHGGNLKPPSMLLDFLETLEASELKTFRKLTQEARDLRRVLNELVRGGSEPARELLERLGRLLETSRT